MMVQVRRQVKQVNPKLVVMMKMRLSQLIGLKGDDGQPIWPEFNPKIEMGNPVYKMRMLFSTNKVFKEAVITYAVKNGKGLFT